MSKDIRRAIVSANLEVTMVRGKPLVEDFSNSDLPEKVLFAYYLIGNWKRQAHSTCHDRIFRVHEGSQADLLIIPPDLLPFRDYELSVKNQKYHSSEINNIK